MAQPGFWQNARSAVQGSPDDELQQLLAAAGQKSASPGDISQLDAQPVAPVAAGDSDTGDVDRSPAGAFYPTPSGNPIAAPPKRLAPRRSAVSAAPKPAASSASSGSGGGFDLSNPYPGVVRAGFLDQMHEDQLKNSQQQSRTFFMDPEVQKERIDELSKIPQFADLIKGNKDFKDVLAMEASRPNPVDYSGLMGMADVLSNGKYGLRSSYKAPNGDARTKELLGGLDKAQDNDRQTAQALTSLSSSGKAGNDILTAATMLMNKGNQGFKDVAAKRYAFDNPVNNAFKLDASSEKIMKPYRDAQDGIDKAVGLLNNNASVSDTAATLETVKPMVSRLTNFEWSKLGKGGTDMSTRLGQAYNTIVNGTLTETNRGEYRQALQTLREANDAAAQFAVQGRQQLGRAAGIPGNLIDASTSTHYQGSGKKPDTSGSSSPQDPLKDAALKEIERRKSQGK